jgi:hypothetical protein
MSRISAFLLLASAVAANAATLPGQTAVPVVFTKTVNAAKVKTGDTVTAKTMQVIVLPDGSQLPKGTLVTGHIVEARGFKYDDTDYAVQQPSYLAIKMDTVGSATPVVASVRALASAFSAEDAQTPQRTDDTDTLGTVVLVGGAHYSPIDKHVLAGEDDDVVAYNRRHGVCAHLMAADYNGSLHCGGTQTEQAVGVFSPDACGLYGFPATSLSENTADGSFRLSSTHRTVVLRSGSAALLQVQ